MAEEKKHHKKAEHKHEKKVEEKKHTGKKHEEVKKMEEKMEETKKIEGKEENKVEEKKHEEVKSAKKIEQKVVKKEEAIAISNNMKASKKHSMAICKFIMNKDIDQSIFDLQQVLKYKKAVPMKGEIPHRKGMMSGRYPINAAKEFIYLLKALKGNCIVNGLELEKTRIYFASATWASRAAQRYGGRFKRVHIILKAKEVKMKENKKPEKVEEKKHEEVKKMEEKK